MRSSGSTPSRPPDPRIPLLLLVVGEDHPKACTGRRLLRAGEARRVGPGAAPVPPPIVLDPHAPHPLSAPDRARAERAGLLGIDCSWNRLAERGGLPAHVGWLQRLGHRRRLPLLIAGNPQHYGRLGELNTAEAFGAALYVLGEAERARGLLGRFAGGEGFLTLNRAALDRFAAALDADAVRAAEREFY